MTETKQLQYNSIVNIFYDSDEMLFYTKIGVINQGILNSKTGLLPLHYTVWGRTKPECKERAESLLKLLYTLNT